MSVHDKEKTLMYVNVHDTEKALVFVNVHDTGNTLVCHVLILDTGYR